MRKKREEEKDDFRVQQVHRDSRPVELAERAGGFVLQGGRAVRDGDGCVVTASERNDAHIDQVGDSRVTDGGEQDRGRGDDQRDAERGQRRVYEQSRTKPQGHRDPRLTSLDDALGHDKQNIRTRHQGQ